MNQNDFLLLNAGVVTLVVLYLVLMRRKPAQPVKLRLNVRESKAPVLADDGNRSPPPSPPIPPIPPKRPFERALNVSFTFDDGNTYDAFEVLQIPAGSSPSSALIAFNTLSRIMKPEQLPLLKAALAAIQKT